MLIRNQRLFKSPTIDIILSMVNADNYQTDFGCPDDYCGDEKLLEWLGIDSTASNLSSPSGTYDHLATVTLKCNMIKLILQNTTVHNQFLCENNILAGKVRHEFGKNCTMDKYFGIRVKNCAIVTQKTRIY